MTASRESATNYQAADGSELPMLVFEPVEGGRPGAGIVMFHGGALRSGSADGLAPHCRQLASRGIFQFQPGIGCSVKVLGASTTASPTFDGRLNTSRDWPRCAGSNRRVWRQVLVRPVVISRSSPR
jgi:hypothetical protein